MANVDELYDLLRNKDAAVLGPMLDAECPDFYERAVEILHALDPEASLQFDALETHLAKRAEDRMDEEIAVLDAIEANVLEITDGLLTFDHDKYPNSYGFWYA